MDRLQGQLDEMVLRQGFPESAVPFGGLIMLGTFADDATDMLHQALMDVYIADPETLDPIQFRVDRVDLIELGLESRGHPGYSVVRKTSKLGRHPGAEGNREEMDRDLIPTPWGNADHMQKLAPGVLQVSTAAHGGLKLSCERWLDLPEEARRSFIHPLFPEEDCEAPIALTILGLADRETRAAAIWAARQFTIYAGALPYLQGVGQ